jgi:hypothetical protein
MTGAVVALVTGGLPLVLLESARERPAIASMKNGAGSAPTETSVPLEPSEAKLETESPGSLEESNRAISAEQTLDGLKKIAITNPTLALKLAETSDRTDEEKGLLLAALAATWAARDPSAAWKWILSQSSRLPFLPGHPPIMERVTEEIAKVDPNGLAVSANLLMDGSRSSEDKSFITEVAMNSLIKTGHGNLALACLDRWIHGGQRDSVSGEALAAVAGYMAKTSSSAKAAASWLESLPECSARATALNQHAVAWARHDPVAALNWTNNLGEMRPVAMRSAFSEWMQQDISAAFEWLAPQVSTEKTDPAVDRLVRLVVEGCTPEDLPSVASWGQNIPGATLRDFVVRQSVRRWAEQDYAAASDYVQQSPQLTAEQRKDLSQYLQDLVEPVSR